MSVSLIKIPFAPRSTCEVESVQRHGGIAGQVAYVARVKYHGEPAESVTFVSNIYGGPIVMRTASGIETFVSLDVTDRIGTELTSAWVRRFFA